MTSRPQIILLSRLLLSAYLLLVVISCLASQAGYYDEPLLLVQGRMVTQGHVPHVDFWSIYPPLTYYLDAAAFSVFGRTILAQRLLQAGLYVLFLLLANRFLRARFASAPLVVEATTFLLAVAIGPKFLLPAFIGFSISLFALFAYFIAYQKAKSRLWQRVALAGLLAGLALCSRFNFGAYAVAAIALDLMLVQLFRSDNEGSEQVRTLRSWLTMAIFAGSTLVSWIGTYLLMCGPNLAPAIKQSIIFPQQEVMGSRFVPLQFNSALVLAILFPCSWFCFRLIVGRVQIPRRALVPLAFAVIVLFIAWFRGGNPAVALDVTVAELAFVLLLHIFIYRLESAEITLVLFFACFLHYFLSRADDWHSPLLLPLACLLVPYLLLSPAGVPPPLYVERVKLGSALALFALLIAVLWCVPGYRPSQIRNGIELIAHGGLFQRVSDSQRILDPASPPKPWIPIYSDLDELKALRFLRLRTSRKDPIFIGVDNHALPYAVDVRAYWLLDRIIGSNYYIFDSGLTSQQVIQQAMIADLQKNHVRWVVLEHDPPMDESFRQRSRPGSKLLDEFLATNFAEVARFGRYGVLKKIET